ncbi:SOS response-associated peptidase [Altibacter sp.]|uniref:SOS response-associated peptidase n=1 Tax=Altibacter sp. TaxID=2024823 RepID=UPI002586C35E|nr:SOS response-associated peptidase [Altibacter sp.]MCW8981118.1 SOS response-associated peptidase [Altibacter sp.]MCW9036348.1 SOS response-associated peptidase [Altibacter sp.]
MCYDIKASLEAQLNRARRRNDLQAIDEIMERLLPLTDLPIYHYSGFSHPEILIYTDRSPDFPEVATWGLIPHWVKDIEQSKKLWNNTLNARGETIFDKPSFRTSAMSNRCIIFVDGFYEHHHFDGSTYPFFIYHGSGKPLPLAGLWSEWSDPDSGGVILTFSIVTTTGNTLLSRIHNNPKLKGPRMPVILLEEDEDDWLQPMEDELDKKRIEKLIQEYPEDELKAHSVTRLRGKEYPGNVSEISEEVIYPALKEQFGD